MLTWTTVGYHGQGYHLWELSDRTFQAYLMASKSDAHMSTKSVAVLLTGLFSGFTSPQFFTYPPPLLQK